MGEWGISTSWGLFFVLALTNTVHISISCMINKVPKKCLSYENCDRFSDFELGYSKDFHTGIFLCETRVSTHESHRSLPGSREYKHNVIFPIGSA